MTTTKGYTDAEQRLIAKLCALVIQNVSNHADGNIRVAASSTATAFLTFLTMMADVADVESAHKFIDSMLVPLHYLRGATTPEEMFQRLETLSDGVVDGDGTLHDKVSEQ